MAELVRDIRERAQCKVPVAGEQLGYMCLRFPEPVGEVLPAKTLLSQEFLDEFSGSQDQTFLFQHLIVSSFSATVNQLHVLVPLARYDSRIRLAIFNSEGKTLSCFLRTP